MNKPLKVAFVGFRHGHVMGLWTYANESAAIDVVAACEEDAATRAQLQAAGKVSVTHTDYRAMLRDVPCDAVAVGDYFGKRGEIVIAALEAGKHVIADKPICTRIEELQKIEELVEKTGLRIGCLLDLRDHGIYRAMRTAIRAGSIGEVQTISFSAQHPLMMGKRPGWYFEEGKHGGVLNDIAIHAVDLIPWMTGRGIVGISAARVWAARKDIAPTFEAGGQVMLRLDNSGGVLGDVSYLSPDGLGYAAEQYWRVTCHGTEGVIEGRYAGQTAQLAGKGDAAVREIPAEPERTGGVIENFLAEVEGRSGAGMLTTKDVLEASRKTLYMQGVAGRS